VIPAAAVRALGRPLAARAVSGGMINSAWRLELEGGARAFVKARADAPPDEYATEAAALRWLAAGGARVPAVLAVERDFLALEWVEAGPLDARAEEALGRTLAQLHGAGAPAFGAPPPGAPFAGLRLGPIELPAATGAGWPAFYAEHRLAPLLRMAADRAVLDADGVRAVQRVIDRADALAGPPEPPARLHGDLWQGNVLAGAYLVDPAAYGGHREVDWAMLRLFGSPAPRTFAAYEELLPLAPGHDERLALYQLLPMLVHALLFGGHYVASVVAAARRAAR
jgi:fructosamine-3-kinase